jgi:hypothetical protein
MNEEEAKARLKARLEGWQAYLGDDAPAVSAAALADAPGGNERVGGVLTERADADSFSLALLAEEASSTNEADEAQSEAARIAALKAAIARERAQSRLSAETLPREQRFHAVTLGGIPSYSPSVGGSGSGDDYPLPDLPYVPPADGEQRRSAILLTISFLTLAGFCGIFAYVLFGK